MRPSAWMLQAWPTLPRAKWTMPFEVGGWVTSRLRPPGAVLSRPARGQPALQCSHTCMPCRTNIGAGSTNPFCFFPSCAAYRAAGQWRMCFALASRAGWPADQQRRLAAGLADELSAIGRGAEAAAISLEYLKNVDSAGAGRQGFEGACAPGKGREAPALRLSLPAGKHRRAPASCLHPRQLATALAQCCCWRTPRSGARRCALPTATPGEGGGVLGLEPLDLSAVARR